MRKLITFLLVAATVALSLLTAIMMFSATDIFPLPSDFQESAASIISRIAAVLAEAVLVSGLCVATHFLIKKEKVSLLADRILFAVWLFLTGVCITFLCVVYKMDFRLTVILTLVGLFAAGGQTQNQYQRQSQRDDLCKYGMFHDDFSLIFSLE